MGIRSHALAFVAGAALVLYAIPESNRAIREEASGLLSQLKFASKLLQKSSPQDQSFLGSSCLKSLEQVYDDEEQWRYNGSNWPSEKWPIFNNDGSYNKAYVKWHEIQCRR